MYFFNFVIYNCERFEPRGHFKSRLIKLNPDDQTQPTFVIYVIAIARSIHQGLGLRLPCNDLTYG